MLPQWIEELLEAICVVNKQDEFVYVSGASVRVFGYEPEEMIGRSMWDFVYPEDRHLTKWATGEINSGVEKTDFENRYVKKDGSLAYLQWSARWSEKEQVRVAVARDISSHKKKLDELHSLAFYDPLTGLPNRALLFDRLNQAIARCRRDGRCLALCFIDLNKFKEINDEHGHAAGDLVLCEVARSLRHSLRDSDNVARLGGDEFVVFFDYQDAKALEPTLEKLKKALKLTLSYQGRNLAVEGCIGVSLYPHHQQEAELLLTSADQAMYQAKQAGLRLFLTQVG